MTDGANSKQDEIRSGVEGLTPQERTALEQRLLAKRRGAVPRTTIPRRELGAQVPLSFAQQRMWLLEQLAPDNPAHVIADAVLIAGDLDVSVLRRSFEELLRRHESLRTTFAVVDGEPVQVVADEPLLDMPVENLDCPADERLGERVSALLADTMGRSVDIEHGPVCRVRLFRTDDGAHLLLILVHHIVSDAWSHDVMMRELAALYEAFSRGEPSPLAPPAIQYADFAVWQRQWLQGDELERQISYWREQLDGVPTLELPTDRPRPALPDTRGAHEYLVLPRRSTEALRTLCGTEEYTVYMVMLAAISLLLARYSGQDDIVIGAPIANRNRSELDGVVGFFVNMLVLRTDLSGDPTGRQLLERVREVVLTANEHQDVPFEKLVDELHPVRDLSRTPFFQVAYEYRRLETAAPSPSKLRMHPVGFALDVTRFDLELHAWERGDDIGVQVVYRSDLFEASTIQRMLAHLTVLLDGLITSPDEPISRLELLDRSERRRLLVEWNETRRPFHDDRCIHQWFEMHAQRAPDAVALVCEDETLTYGELDRRANRLARELQDRGVRPDALVGLCAERGAEMVVGLIGILKAGGAYVPLDPGYPAERLEFMLADSGVSVLVTQTHVAAGLPDHAADVLCLDRDLGASDPEREEALPCVTDPENLAYVIYTSGSTGTPKGAMLRHRGLCNLSEEQARAFGVGPGSRVLQFSSLSFDASTFEMVMALAKGASLFLGRRETLLPGPDLLEFLRRHAISIVTLPPSALGATPVEPLPDLATITVAGEACPEELVTRWAPGRRFFNLYGPTEATIWSTMAELEAGAGVPHIGRPIGNTRIYVLDERMRPVPAGVPGELCIAGVGLARGYHRRPAMTAERFVPNPFGEAPGERLYRSGDLVRYRADGNVEFLGRIDHQVKLRGFRIELGEIEAALGRHPSVRETTVLCREDRPGEKELVAYVVSGSDAAPVAGELRRFLGETLPEYMVPAAYVTLDAMPVTRNGKIDRAALPAPSADRATGEAYLAPRSELEERISAIWCDVLGVEQVGVRDNFFELGGHSLRLVQVHARMVEDLGCSLSVTDLFQLPTIEALAERLRGASEPVTALRHDARARVERRGRVADEAIAVIGMSARFPGAPDVDTFWSNLRDGVESIRFYTDEELREAGVDEALLRHPGYVKAFPTLDDADLFDARYFGYTPREAELMDPQHRVFLECAVEALEHAGYDPDRYDGLIAVYAGASVNDYRANVQSDPERRAAAAGLQGALGSHMDFLPTRVSYKLNLRGPSMNIQTACSTSLVAVHEACRSLLDQQCDMALVGGVSISVPNVGGYVYQEGGIVSPDGHCRSFDARAQGTLRGDGAGIVVLKRLREAMRDGDEVHAVILGTAVNNDGSNKVGYTAPSVDGQAQVIALAQAAAGVDAESITYVEAHGTATPLGDPIEVAALTKVFREQSDRVGYCGLGSAKSNMGHLDAAAGVAGLIKTILSLRNRAIPPSLHYERPNPEIDFEHSPFYVNTTLRRWETEDQARRAGVSSFGLGGTNVHAVLEEAPELPASDPPCGPQIIVLSARTTQALADARTTLAAHLRAHQTLNLADVAYTLQVGRRQLERRLAVPCGDVAEAVAALEGERPEIVSTGNVATASAGVVFMFSGQGAQDVNMGRELYQEEGPFREAVDACLEIVDGELGLNLRDVLYPEGAVTAAARERLKRTSMAQPALFTVSFALAQRWMAWGIEPESMIGHSIGEFVAACLAGVLSLDDALRLVVARGRLMESMPPGVMTAVSMPREDLETELTNEEGLWLSAVNAPSLCVVSGRENRVEALESRLAASGLECRRLHTSHAFHSGLMDGAVAPFMEAVRDASIGAPRIPYVSNVTGDWITEADVRDVAYWGRHIREPVRFGEGMQRLLSDTSRVLLEVGPGQVLSALTKHQGELGRDRVAVPSMRRARSSAAERPDESDALHLAGALGRLWAGGVAVDWLRVHGQARRRRVTLPTYRFQRERFWVDPAPVHRAAPMARRNDLADWFYVPAWCRSRLAAVNAHATSTPSFLVFVADTGFGTQVVERLGESGRVIAVKAGSSFDAEGHLYTINPSKPADYERLISALVNEGGVPAQIVLLWGATGARERRLSPAVLDHVQDVGFFGLLDLLRELGGQALPGPVRVSVVTDGVHEVTGGEVIFPEKATVIGPCRVTGLEFPNIRCRNIDLAAEETEQCDEKAVALLVQELLSDAREEIVAHRRGQRWVQSFAPIRLEKPEGELPSRLRRNGTYLLTGGLGGIGLEVAGYLARSAQAKLVLVGRRGLPDRSQWGEYIAQHGESDAGSKRIRAVEAMEVAGGEVLIADVDVSSLEQMQSIVARAKERFGSIDGVFHLAGTPGGGVILRRHRDEAAGVMSPKVTGAQVLERLFGTGELDFMVLFSSLISSRGLPGRVEYCAANAYLDAFARRFAADTATDTVAIDWTTWREAGMAVDATRDRAQLGSIQGISSEEGIELLQRILDQGDERQILTSETDLRDVFQTPREDRGEEGSATAPQTPARKLHPRPTLSTEFLAPRTEAEEKLAEIWQGLFGVEQIGVNDNFFDLSGDSVLSIQMAARAKEAGIPLSTKNVMELPTIAQLAATVDDVALVVRTEDEAPQQPAVGDVPLTPIQQWFLELDLEAPEHFNHAVLLQARCALAPAQWEDVVRALLEHHDALRLHVVRQGGGWRQISAEPPTEVPFTIVDLSGEPEGRRTAAIEAAAGELQASLDLAAGPIVRTALFDLGRDEPPRLLVVAHHLGIDAVSWPILLEDLARLVDQQIRGVPRELPAKTTSFQAWARHLYEHALSPAVAAEAPYWRNLPWSRVAPLPVDTPDAGNTIGDCATVSVTLDEAETRRLLQDVPRAYRTRIDDVLLTALARAFEPWTGRSALLVDLEGHGREPLFDDVDLSRTVGWFTSMYPVLLDTGGAGDPGSALKRVKEQVRSVPGRGIGYGLLRYLHPDQSITDELRALPAAEVSFLYFGQQAAAGGSAPEGMLVPAPEPSGAGMSPRNRRAHLIEIMSGIGAGRLSVEWTYSTEVHRRETVEALAERFIQSLRELIEHCTSGDARGYTPSDFPYAKVGQDELDRIEARYGADDIEDLCALSPMQQGMLFHRLQEPTSGMYMEQTRLYLEQLDPDGFRRAWERVMARHTALRTSIIHTDSKRPLQLVHRQVPLPLTEHDLRGKPEAEITAWVDALAATDRCRDFDEDDASRMRLALVRVDDDAYEFVWTLEHLIIDGWSKTLLVGEVFGLYGLEKDGTAYEPGVPRPYRDYIAWLHAQDPEEAAAYWRGALGDFETPTLVGRPAAKEPSDGAQEIVERQAALSEEVTKRLKRIAAELSVTLNIVVLGAWSLLLGRCVGSDDVVLGTPVSGRPPDLPGVESIVGLCLNTVPFRARLDGDATLSSWLRSLQAQQIERSRFEYGPLWEVQRWSGVPVGTPLFDNLFVFQNFPVEPSTVAADSGVTLEARKFVEHVSYPVMLAVHPGDRLLFRLTCDLAVIEEDAMGRLLDHLATVLRGFVSDPQQRLRDISLLDDTEREQIVVAWNRTTSYPVDLRVHERFELQVARTPDATALVFEDQRLTYDELNVRANRLAHHLRARGVGPEVLLGLCVERSLDLIVAILGVLKAGGAYVPLDPCYPKQRLSFIFDDSCTRILLTQSNLAGDLPDDRGEVVCLDADAAAIARQPETNPARVGTVRDTAYVIYTSGSTGTPKGVLVQHDAVARLFAATEEWYGFDERDVWTLFHSCAFDFSVWEIWGALLYGGRLVVVPYEVSRSPEEFHALVRREGVTVLNQTPSAFRQFVNADAATEGCDELALRWVIFGGEALEFENLRPWFKRHGDRQPQLVNMYGITETTVHVTHRPLGLADLAEAPGSVIGRPIPDLRVFVLDAHGQPCPIDFPGEMYVGGTGVARGYLARPALTAERFVPDPFGDAPGARLYRTGDVARLLANGDLQYLGRNDEQVKVRGFRIELGEIEAAIARHDRVREAVAMVREDRAGDRRLVVYVVPTKGPSLSTSGVREFLKERLPEYMLPSSFVVLESLPLTPSGKLDRGALPRPDSAGTTEHYEAPRTRFERELAAIWSTVLGVETVGVHDNFFALGGDSILSIQIVARANDAGFRLTPRQLLQRHTIAELAQVAEARTRVTAEQGDVTGDVPLTPIQRWFFERDLSEPHHFNQAMLFAVRIRTPAPTLRDAFRSIMKHHDALRLRYERRNDEWHQWNAPPDEDVPLVEIDLTGRAEASQLEAIRSESEKLQRSLALQEGPLLGAALFDLGGDAGQRLLVVIHHLAVDGVSWRILGEDLQRACANLRAGEAVRLPAKTTSFQDWARRIETYAQGDELEEELDDHWLRQPWSDVGTVRPDREGGDNTGQALELVTASLTESETSALLHVVPVAYKTQINDVLLTALGAAMASWTGRDTVLIDLEGHGREDLFDDVDISRTVGWFTTMYPVVLDLRESLSDGQLDPGTALKSVKEQIRAIPGRGIGYGLARYLSADASMVDRLADLPRAQLSFNYLGQFDQMFDGESMLGFADEPAGTQVSPRNRRSHLVDVGASIVGGRLGVHLGYGADVFDRATMERVAGRFMASLRELIEHCRSKADRDYTPSDFPLADLDADELDQIGNLLDQAD